MDNSEKRVILHLYASDRQELDVSTHKSPESLLARVYSTTMRCAYYDENMQPLRYLQDAVSHLGVANPQELIAQFTGIDWSDDKNVYARVHQETRDRIKIFSKGEILVTAMLIAVIVPLLIGLSSYIVLVLWYGMSYLQLGTIVMWNRKRKLAATGFFLMAMTLAFIAISFGY